MIVANSLAYYITAKITTVKNVKAQASWENGFEEWQKY